MFSGLLLSEQWHIGPSIRSAKMLAPA